MATVIRFVRSIHALRAASVLTNNTQEARHTIYCDRRGIRILRRDGDRTKSSMAAPNEIREVQAILVRVLLHGID